MTRYQLSAVIAGMTAAAVAAARVVAAGDGPSEARTEGLRIGFRIPEFPSAAAIADPSQDEPPSPPEASTAPPPAASVPFGRLGSNWWTVGGGVASDFRDTLDSNVLRVAFGRFLADDVEVSLEFNAWQFRHEGDDAAGFNPAVVVRWHCLNRQTWTLFADLGLGVLLASDPVPDGGTRFNFMPRAGVGFTRELSPGGVRLQVGVRWHHVSNARIVGDARNPARDLPMLYAGLMVPF